MGVQGSALNGVPLPNTREAWNIYGLDQIWEMLCDEDGIDSFRQVTAWYRMAHLCTDQADQLEKALAQLMLKWPPNPGSAAQAFKLRVEDLILSMRDSAAAAKANEEPLIRITSLISDAKDAVLALRQQRASNAKAEAEWTAKAIVPFATVPPSPVEPGWRDALDRQARDIMHATDVAIGQAAADFRAPTKYRADVGPREEFRPWPPGPATGSGRMVPPPVFDPPTIAPPAREAGEMNIPPGFASLDDTILDGTRLPSPGQSPELVGPNSVTAFVDTPVGRVLAPGGVIGAGDGDRTGSAGPGGAAGIEHGSIPMSGMMAPPLGRGVTHQAASNAIRTGGRRRRRSDPDDPWVPPTGGPSVLEAAPEPEYFDPGPNVIGIDR